MSLLGNIDCKHVVPPYDELLIWICELKVEYELKELGEKLEETVDRMKTLYKEDTDSFYRILKFLMHFKNIPKPDENKLVSVKSFLYELL